MHQQFEMIISFCSKTRKLLQLSFVILNLFGHNIFRFSSIDSEMKYFSDYFLLLILFFFHMTQFIQYFSIFPLEIENTIYFGITMTFFGNDFSMTFWMFI